MKKKGRPRKFGPKTKKAMFKETQGADKLVKAPSSPITTLNDKSRSNCSSNTASISKPRVLATTKGLINRLEDNKNLKNKQVSAMAPTPVKVEIETNKIIPSTNTINKHFNKGRIIPPEVPPESDTDAKFRKNERERRRRLMVSQGFSDLVTVLNLPETAKVDKATVLNNSIKRIQVLEAKVELLQAENKRLKTDVSAKK